MARCTRASGKKTGERAMAFVSIPMDPGIKALGKTTKEMAWVSSRGPMELRQEEHGGMTS
jgi:hypothetical protein